MTIKIKLSDGFYAIVDDIDADLNNKNWCCKNQTDRSTQYAQRSNNDGTTSLMHRVILSRIIGKELSSNELTDHIDGNGLNNKRNNLRVANYSQNQANRGPQKNNKTGYKGVHEEKGKYRVQVYCNGKNKHVGYFDDIHEAARAYNEKAVKLFGKFAWVNEIND